MRAVAVLSAALVVVSTAAAAEIKRQANTASYTLRFVVGPTEPMYTQAEVTKMHPKTGEVMVGHAMSGGSMSSTGKANRHLEVHVNNRNTGAVVTNVTPQITVTDTGAPAMAEELEVMAMQGIGHGKGDLHYGNNITLKPGHTYKARVVVKGEKATFTFKA